MNQQDWDGPDASTRPMGVEAMPDAAPWQAPGAPYGPGRPAGAPPLAPQLHRLLMQMLQQLEAGFPAEEVIHSLHTELLRDPAIRDLPSMRRFSEAGLREVHSEVAAAGYMRRILCGDRSPAVLPGLREQLVAMNTFHNAARTAYGELASAPELRANPTVQALGQVLNLDTQNHRRVTAMAAPLLGPAAPPAQR